MVVLQVLGVLGVDGAHLAVRAAIGEQRLEEELGETIDRAREVLKTLIENDPDNARLDGRTFEPRLVDAEPLTL